MYDARAHGALCDVCSLCGPGQQPKCVPPGGNTSARIALVGEAPGKNEMQKGAAFVGASGIKLDELLWHAGLKRADVWISNASLCRAEVPNSEAANRFSSDEYMKWVQAENKRRKKQARATKTQPTLLVDPFTACRPRLMRELASLDANARAAGAPSGVTVLPMGNYALYSLRGVRSIMKYRGSVMLPRADDFADTKHT